jgi:hypothetical protein
MRTRLPAADFAAWTRRLGALALLGVGLDHLDEFAFHYYSAIPTIGTLFVVNFAAATLLACGLAAPVGWLRGRAGLLLGAGGIGVAAGSLAALLVSERTPLFGFMEFGYRPAIVLSIGLDVATVVLLGLHIGATRRGRRQGVVVDRVRVTTFP